MTITTEEILHYLSTWLWVFSRITGMLMVAPILSMNSVPVKIRMALGFLLTLVIAPLIPPSIVDVFTLQGLIVGVQQFIIGAAIGVAARMIFFVMEFMGQIIAQQMGLGFAAMIDPANGSQVPVISQFYLIIANLVFLNINGHLALFTVIAESFYTLPINDSVFFSRDNLWGIVLWVGWIFSQGFLMSLPAVTALLIVNLAFGVMSRAAPQLSIFSVGFSVMVILGISILYMTSENLEPHFIKLFVEAMNFSYKLSGKN